MTKHYFVELDDGTIETRSSASGRDYTHAVVVYGCKWDAERKGGVAAYSGSKDLAEKAANQWRNGNWFAENA